MLFFFYIFLNRLGGRNQQTEPYSCLQRPTYNGFRNLFATFLKSANCGHNDFLLIKDFDTKCIFPRERIENWKFPRICPALACAPADGQPVINITIKWIFFRFASFTILHYYHISINICTYNPNLKTKKNLVDLSRIH